LRQETNVVLGRLTAGNALRLHDPLHAEREATNHLLTMLMEHIEETAATLRLIEKKAERLAGLSPI
jgi:hypothetical protein